jgi:hypothetical protein
MFREPTQRPQSRAAPAPPERRDLGEATPRGEMSPTPREDRCRGEAERTGTRVNPERVSAEAATPSGFEREHTPWPPGSASRIGSSFSRSVPEFREPSSGGVELRTRRGRPVAPRPISSLDEHLSRGHRCLGGGLVGWWSRWGHIGQAGERGKPRGSFGRSLHPLGVLLSAGSGANPVSDGSERQRDGARGPRRGVLPPCSSGRSLPSCAPAEAGAPLPGRFRGTLPSAPSRAEAPKGAAT